MLFIPQSLIKFCCLEKAFRPENKPLDAAGFLCTFKVKRQRQDEESQNISFLQDLHNGTPYR